MGKSLGILVQLVSIADTARYGQLGVEPIAFYCFGPSKKPRQRDFLLLTLTKLGGGGEIRTLFILPYEDNVLPIILLHHIETL